MDDKKKFLFILIGMVVLIGGAYLLYNALGDKLEMPGLVIQSSPGAENVGAGDSVPVEGNGQEATAGGDGGMDSSSEADAEEVREPAPDFTVYDADGNAYKLSDFRGKPVVLNFWASWCGPCKSEMPDFQEIYDVYGKEIHFLMVNMTDGAQETMESASSYVAQSGYTFPVYYDTDMDAAYTYGVYSIPTTYFFDAEGYGIAYGQGAMDKETILTGIGMLQGEESDRGQAK